MLKFGLPKIFIFALLFLTFVFFQNFSGGSPCPDGWTAIWTDPNSGSTSCHKDGETGLNDPSDWMTILPTLTTASTEYDFDIPNQQTNPIYTNGQTDPFQSTYTHSDYPLLGGGPTDQDNSMSLPNRARDRVTSEINEIQWKCPLLGSFLRRMPIHAVNEGLDSDGVSFIARIHTSSGVWGTGNLDLILSTAYIELNVRCFSFSSSYPGLSQICTAYDGSHTLRTTLIHEALHEILGIDHTKVSGRTSIDDDVYRFSSMDDCGESTWKSNFGY